MLIKKLLMPSIYTAFDLVVPSIYTKRDAISRFMSTHSNKNDVILTKEFNDMGMIIFNRPNKLNAVNLEMCQIFSDIINKWKDNKSLIIVRGNGEKAFCAGGDIQDMVHNGPEYSLKLGKNLFTSHYWVKNLKCPYVALIDGITMGAGLGYAIHGNYRVATENTVCAMPEVMIGYFPDNATSHFFPRLPGNIGYYLALTASKLKGKEVLQSGIATHYCESSRIPTLEHALCNLENANNVEEVLNDFCPKIQLETDLSKIMNQITECFDADSVEEIFSKLEKDGSDWAERTTKIMRSASPISLVTTFYNLKWGSKKSLGECLQMDYRLAHHFMYSNNFSEGVRALLLEKDNKPKWSPERIEDLAKGEVSSLFRTSLSPDVLPINVQLPESESELMHSY